MLKRLTESQQRLLELADHLDGIQDNEFDMDSWCKCICAHAVRLLLGDPEGTALRDAADPGMGARLLGLDRGQAAALFAPAHLMGSLRLISRERAARQLRHLAITGEVDWDQTP